MFQIKETSNYVKKKKERERGRGEKRKLIFTVLPARSPSGSLNDVLPICLKFSEIGKTLFCAFLNIINLVGKSIFSINGDGYAQYGVPNCGSTSRL